MWVVEIIGIASFVRGTRSGFWALIFSSLFGVVAFRAQATAAEPLAEVNGVAITAQELDRALGTKLTQLQEQIYNLKSQELDALIRQRLLATEAAKRGVSVTALLDLEVTSKVDLVTEQEIDAFYHANKGGVKGDEATVRQQIRAYLQHQKLTARLDLFVQSLRSQAKIVVHLKPPPVHRLVVSTDGAPFRGAPDAPVTIVEFSDFHCPFCKGVLPTLTQLESRYGDKIRIVFRDYPIDGLHPAARKGHEAARCASEQGKFWPYHDKLFANAPKAAPEDLRTYATEVGLNLGDFEKCFSSGKYQAAVQKDIDDGLRAGVTGTPAFFINGRLLSGAQPIEAFTRVIEEELTRAAASRKASE